MKVFLALCALALVWSANAASSTAPLAAPTGLHAFVYRATEVVKSDHTYTQLPAFAWNQVSGAGKYEVQLATSSNFLDSTMLVDNKNVDTPVTSLQIQLPWMTGHPYALYVRVRAYDGSRVSPWGPAFGFNTSWQQIPQQLPSANGLVRWTPVDGATAYDVWFQDIGLRVRTITNVADEREYWLFFPNATGTIHWRVRAVRYVVTPNTLPNQIQKITYGPYSRTFTSVNNTALGGGGLSGTDALSNVDSTPSSPQANEIMPGFSWTGTTGIYGENPDGLRRVYVFSDKECVNMVTVGGITAGPAWAPRFAPPPIITTDVKKYPLWRTGFPDEITYGSQVNALMADGTKIVTAEEAAAAAAQASTSSSSSGGGTSATGTGTGGDPAFTTYPGAIALPDLGWPTGRYWWTVVPVRPIIRNNAYWFVDTEMPQDACAAGRVWPFGMQSMAVTTQQSSPLVSGLHGNRVVSSATTNPAFVASPVIAWKPATGAQSYEIQLSRHLYPWRTKVTQSALVPSVTLNLTRRNVGVWYYRVRGINGLLPGSAIKMSWSKPTKIRISGDAFTLR